MNKYEKEFEKCNTSFEVQVTRFKLLDTEPEESIPLIREAYYKRNSIIEKVDLELGLQGIMSE